MSPLEAYFHIRSILEHLNAVVAEQFASLMFEKSVSMTTETLRDNPGALFLCLGRPRSDQRGTYA